MSGIKEYLREFNLDFIIIEINEIHYQTLGLTAIEESRWFASSKKGWSFRVDPPNPEMNIQRHVTVARTKHINAKSKQVSWNQDLTRHDKKTFNVNLSGMETAKQIARQALNLQPDDILEGIEPAGQLLYLIESIDNETAESSIFKPVYLRLKK